MSRSEHPQRGNAVSFLLACAALVALPSCNVFDARSGELSCSLPTDCSADRTCESGYCVVRNILEPDADLNAADAGPCSLLFTDDFEDGLAAPLWIESDTAMVTITEASGVLTFSSADLPSNPVTVSYSSVTRNYDMTTAAFAIEIPTMVDTASKASVRLVIGSAGNSNITFEQVSGTLKISVADGGQSTLADTPYDATEHRWWRAVESTGTLYAQTSPDGSTWTTQGTASTPAFIGAVGVDLEMRAFSNGQPPGTLVFDNVNIGVGCKP